MLVINYFDEAFVRRNANLSEVEMSQHTMLCSKSLYIPPHRMYLLKLLIFLSHFIESNVRSTLSPITYKIYIFISFL